MAIVTVGSHSMEYEQAGSGPDLLLVHSLLTEMTVFEPVLAALTALDPQKIGLGDFGKPDGFLSRAVEGWAKRAAIAGDGEAPKGASSVIDSRSSGAVRATVEELIASESKAASGG